MAHGFGSAAVEIEAALRASGHIAYYDASHRGLWHFRINGKEGYESINSPELGDALSVRTSSLAVAHQGVFDPKALHKPSQVKALAAENTAGLSADASQRFMAGNSPQTVTGDIQEQEQNPPSPQATPGKDQDASSEQFPAQQTLYESFVSAVLLAISTNFCERSGSMPLDCRTVLFSRQFLESGSPGGSFSEKAPVVGTFKAYIATTGALIISLAMSLCQGLSHFDSATGPAGSPSSQRILAAPLGAINHNQLQSPVDHGTASMAQTPSNQLVSARGLVHSQDSLWREMCLKVLQLRGVASSVLEDCSWVNLHIPRSRLRDSRSDLKRHNSLTSAMAVPWPSPLCFHKRHVEVSVTSRVGDTILSGHEESHDPLGIAQSWFTAYGEREEKVLKRKANRAGPSVGEGNDGDARHPRPNAQSPLGLRRPPAAAAGAMYPTPPDALHNLNGVTPSIDGTLSSPGNIVPGVSNQEVDGNANNSGGTGETYDLMPDLPDSKRQKNDGNLLSDAEHMFEDMGGDMFGDNDITEADFNFFDEQPGVDSIDVSMNDVDGSVKPNDPDARQNGGDFSTKGDAVEMEPEPESVVGTAGSTEITGKPIIDVPSAITSAPDCGRGVQELSIKRELSPFDPQTVFERVRASLSGGQEISLVESDSKHITKIFERMDFDPTLPMINKKYEYGGQFAFESNANSEKPKPEGPALSEHDYLQRHGIQSNRPKGAFTVGAPFDATNTAASPMRLDGPYSDGDRSSGESDSGGAVDQDEELASPVKTTNKQPPQSQQQLDEDDTAQEASARDLDHGAEPDQQLVAELPRLGTQGSPEVPLGLLFSDPEPLSLDLSFGDDDLIEVAQLITDQAATGSLDLCNITPSASVNSIVNQSKQPLLAGTRNAMQIMQESTVPFLRGIKPCPLKTLLDITDVTIQGQSARMQPRPVLNRDSNAEPLRPSNLYQIPGPHLEVRRSDAKLSVLPSAITFWESLGLAPSSGSKHVTAVCVFPGWKGMDGNARIFLRRLKSVYEVLKLGSLENLPLLAEAEDGTLPYEVDRISTSPDANVTGHGTALVDSMETLREALSVYSKVNANVVVYFVYSPGNPGTIVEACAAFHRFFQSYEKDLAAKKEPATNELVLQLVPADIVSSPTALVVTPSSELVKLCLETYDRCTLFGGPMPAPAIRLEQPLPRIIDFKLTNKPSHSLIRENSCIHVAYARTVDERWVSAAWTDDRGNQQATASYCLGRRYKPLSRKLNEVAHEMWETTLDLISAWKVHWRVIITKCGPMDQSEVDFWVGLGRTETKATVTLILMSADTNPSLQLVPPAVKLPQAAMPFYTTPVSTPQANVVSPEHTTTPATPANGAAATPTPTQTPAAGGDSGAAPGETDTDAVLFDITDQTWGAIVGHRLNNTASVLEVRPALVSGYLIKRSGPKTEDAPLAMEVNLIQTDANPRAYEPLFREILSYFRGLATLARARGIVPSDTDVRPWHIAAAEKAARAMYLLM